MTPFRIQQWLKHLTLPAYPHFFIPILSYGSFTDGSVDKPAQITGFKFPRRTSFPSFDRTFFCGPARLVRFTGPLFHVHQKKGLPLPMDRHLSPSLLVAIDSPDRCAKQLSHFPLSLFQSLADILELLAFHRGLQQGFSRTLNKKRLTSRATT